MINFVFVFILIIIIITLVYYFNKGNKSNLDRNLEQNEQNILSSQPTVLKTSNNYSSVQKSYQQIQVLEDEKIREKIDLLEWAIRSSQKIEFFYGRQDDQKDFQTIAPIGFKDIEGTLFLEGYCSLRRARRIFAIEQMQDIKIASISSPPTIINGVEPSAKIESQTPPFGQDRSHTYKNYKFDDFEKRAASEKDTLEALNSNPEVGNTLDSPPSSENQILSPDQDQERPYKNYRFDDLEKIAVSEWNNLTALIEIRKELEFRSRKKPQVLRNKITERITKLQRLKFAWPTTIATNSSHELLGDTFKYGEGILRHCGYKVGASGLPENQRREILDRIFLQPLPAMDNADYLKEWGEPTVILNRR